MKKAATLCSHRPIPQHYEVTFPELLPTTVPGWKAFAEGLLTEEACAFHRNVEISARYACIYAQMPAGLKWTAMAAIASNHVRLAMFPLRLDANRGGRVNLARSLRRPRVLLTADVNRIRQTNNAIFEDIYWVHLAYLADRYGIERLRSLLGRDAYYAQILEGFELIDRGGRVLQEPAATASARLQAADDVWQGNVAILEHEQRVVVQPAFDQLSCAFARILSLGTASAFDVRGLRQELAYFTSFYGYSLTRGMPQVVSTRTWPNVRRLDERWRWLTCSVVPRFRRFEADRDLVDTSLSRVLGEAARFASMQCPGIEANNASGRPPIVTDDRISPPLPLADRGRRRFRTDRAGSQK